ncbi:MAG: SGNH/GDSL hydrolase family protein [Verrucomicrobiota bacterium]
MRLGLIMAAVLSGVSSLPADLPPPDAAPAPAVFVENLRAGRAQTIVYYGTSLTAAGAWTRLLTERLEAGFPGQVVAHNTGGPGMHSGWGLQNVDERVIAHQPDAVFIEFAINDAVARFNLSPERAKANLEKMIDRIHAARPDCEIILQIMNPVIDKPQGDRGWRPMMEVYQNNYREVAKERGLKLIDHMPAWTRLLEQGEPMFRGYVPDGVHPAGDGWREIVMPELLRQLGL